MIRRKRVFRETRRADDGAMDRLVEQCDVDIASARAHKEEADRCAIEAMFGSDDIKLDELMLEDVDFVEYEEETHRPKTSGKSISREYFLLEHGRRSK